MNKRHGFSRADVIVLAVIALVLSGILITLISSKQAEARRTMILQTTGAITDDWHDRVEKLADTVTVHTSTEPVSGVCSASIPVPDTVSRPPVTGPMLKQALHLGILRWASDKNLWLIGGTMEYSFGHAAKTLDARCIVRKKTSS